MSVKFWLMISLCPSSKDLRMVLKFSAVAIVAVKRSVILCLDAMVYPKPSLCISRNVTDPACPNNLSEFWAMERSLGP